MVKSYCLINLLFFIIFHYFHYYHYFYHYHHYSHFCCKEWYTFSCDTALMQQDVFPFVSFNIFVLCCFIPLGFIDHLVCDTAFGMQHTKFFGGYVWPGNIWVIFGWYLGHLESPITPVIHLDLMWIIHILSFQNLIYSSLILLHIFSVISTVSPASVYGISAVFTRIIIVLM